MEERINLQRNGSHARSYQVKQVRSVFVKYKLGASMNSKYEVIIYWSDEGADFVAEVPELPGRAAHGATQAKALASAQEAIRLWIDTAKEFGDRIPTPKGRRLVFA